MPTIALNTNDYVLRAERQLGRHGASVRRSLDRLSSGLRITRVGDDAAGLAVATSLSYDARVVTQGIRNLNDGLGVLDIASGALGEMGDILLRLKELAAQAANGTLADGQREALDGESAALVAEYNRIALGASVNARPLFAGGVSEYGLQAGYGSIPFQLGSRLSLYRGLGTFRDGVAYNVGATNPNSTFIGDFNGDGSGDVAVTAADSRVHVLLGNGDGTLQAQSGFLVNSNLISVRGADFDNDGTLDLVTSSYSDVVGVLLGNGDGTFQPRQNFATGQDPLGISTGDFNRDGFADIVAANHLDNSLSVLLGNGDGTFQPRVNYGVSGRPYEVETADFDGDGILDLVAPTQNNNRANILLGRGDGTFLPVTSFPSGTANTVSANPVDLDGDGIMDITVSGAAHIGNGDGTFRAPVVFSGSWFSEDVGDLNGDGRGDVVVDGGVYLGSITGSPTFSDSVPLEAQWASSGDLNGDGVLDLVSPAFSNSTITVLIAKTRATPEIRPIDLTTQTASLVALDAIDGHTRRVSAERAAVGAYQSRIHAALGQLRITAETSKEAEGKIVDADVAEEAAAAVRGRILLQAAGAVLVHGKQEPALALVLLRDESSPG